MSTEKQDYSIANQLVAIEVYVQLHDFEIVRTYSDAGRSRVDLARRPGLRERLADVASSEPVFEAILV
jgi:DNA invertase Pin-like site-specific DNA recombinase